MKKTNEVSKLVGVSKRTLQYYDDEGILLVERSEKNHRLYDQKVLERIWMIMIYKEMGFELKKIKQLLLVSDDERKEYLGQQAVEIKNHIEKLKYRIEFISFILEHGIPKAPKEGDGITYMDSITELRKRMNMLDTKEENDPLGKV